MKVWASSPKGEMPPANASLRGLKINPGIEYESSSKATVLSMKSYTTETETHTSAIL